MGGRCQVDFYLLGSPALDADRLACRLALMAWERGHTVSILARDDQHAGSLDELLWTYPEGRFLPHERGDGPAAPVRLVTAPPGEDGDVVINLTTTAQAPPLPWNRLLEIVPHREAEREASRTKFRSYRQHGLDPQHHDIDG